MKFESGHGLKNKRSWTVSTKTIPLTSFGLNARNLRDRMPPHECPTRRYGGLVLVASNNSLSSEAIVKDEGLFGDSSLLPYPALSYWKRGANFSAIGSHSSPLVDAARNSWENNHDEFAKRALWPTDGVPEFMASD